MTGRRLRVVAALLFVLLFAGLFYIWTLKRHLDALEPLSEEREFVDRAVEQLRRDGGGATEEWLSGTYPLVIELDRGRRCVDLRPRSRHARSGVACLAADGSPELVIVRGPPLP